MCEYFLLYSYQTESYFLKAIPEKENDIFEKKRGLIYDLRTIPK